MYSNSVRQNARDLWLEGNKTDAEIAAAVGVTRPDTIRAWRNEERWEALKFSVDAAVARRAAAQKRAADADLNDRQDRLAEAVEAGVAKTLRLVMARAEPDANSTALAALANTLVRMQRVRRKARGIPDELPEVPQGWTPPTVIYRLREGPPPVDAEEG